MMKMNRYSILENYRRLYCSDETKVEYIIEMINFKDNVEDEEILNNTDVGIVYKQINNQIRYDSIIYNDEPLYETDLDFLDELVSSNFSNNKVYANYKLLYNEYKKFKDLYIQKIINLIPTKIIIYEIFNNLAYNKYIIKTDIAKYEHEDEIIFRYYDSFIDEDIWFSG